MEDLASDQVLYKYFNLHDHTADVEQQKLKIFHSYQRKKKEKSEKEFNGLFSATKEFFFS